MGWPTIWPSAWLWLRHGHNLAECLVGLPFGPAPWTPPWALPTWGIGGVIPWCSFGICWSWIGPIPGLPTSRWTSCLHVSVRMPQLRSLGRPTSGDPVPPRLWLLGSAVDGDAGSRTTWLGRGTGQSTEWLCLQSTAWHSPASDGWLCTLLAFWHVDIGTPCELSCGFPTFRWFWPFDLTVSAALFSVSSDTNVSAQTCLGFCMSSLQDARISWLRSIKNKPFEVSWSGTFCFNIELDKVLGCTINPSLQSPHQRIANEEGSSSRHHGNL